MKRRELLGSGVLGGLLGGLGEEAAEASQSPQPQQRTVIEDFSGVVDAIGSLEKEIAGSSR